MRPDRLSRAITGQTRFCVTEVFPDLFFADCVDRGLELKNIVKYPDRLFCDVSFQDKRRFFEAVGASGGSAAVVSQSGALYVLHRYRFRIGIPLGMLLFLIIYFILCGIVWNVEADGFERIDREAFLSYMAEHGIKKGAFVSCIDCGEAEYAAELFSDQIEKAVVNVIGCKVFVSVKERVEPPEQKDERLYSNLIASKDGEVLSADFLAGTPEIRAGDAVLRGQLLAGGICELTDGTVRYTRAHAVVIARTQNALSVSVPEKISAAAVSRIKTLRLPCFFYCFGANAESDDKTKKYNSVYRLHLHETDVPIGVCVNRSVSLSSADLALSEKSMLLLCFSAYAERAYDRFGDLKVTGRSENVFADGAVRIEAVYVCEENICEEKIFEIMSE